MVSAALLLSAGLCTLNGDSACAAVDVCCTTGTTSPLTDQRLAATMRASTTEPNSPSAGGKSTCSPQGIVTSLTSQYAYSLRSR